MKKVIIISVIIMSFNLAAQVGIGKEAPDPSAILDVESTEKGFLPPRMTTVQRDAINSGSFTEGLVIYNTDINCIQYWNNTQWISFCDGSNSPGGGNDDDDFSLINYRLGASNADVAMSGQQTSDGGYIIAGYSSGPTDGDVSGTPNGQVDYWIVKLDASGDIEWDKLYGGSGSEHATSIQQTADGGYVVAGYSNSSASGDVSGNNHGGYDYWILKLDSAGNKIWDKLYGGSGDDNLYSVRQTTDGGYIAVGGTNSSNSGDVSGVNKGIRDAWIVKLDTSGDIVWKRLYGGNDRESANSVRQTTDGGYIVAGVSQSSASGNVSDANNGLQDYWIIKLDTSGVIVWNKLYGGSGRETPNSIQQTSDGGYIVVGLSNSSLSGDVSDTNKGENDYWVLKLDASGNKVWDKLYGGSSNEDATYLQQTADGGYIISGNSQSSASGDVSDTNNGTSSSDYWILKLDVAGNKVWDKMLGGNDTDLAAFVHQTTNGGYFVGGTSGHESAGNGDQVDLISRGSQDYWILFLDQNGNLIEP